MQSEGLPGQRAKQLIQEIQRSVATGPLELQRYNEDGVRMVVNESVELLNEMQELMGEEEISDLPNPVKVALFVHDASMKRNKRCLQAYLYHRDEAIKQLRWQYGAVLPEGVRSNMSRHEQDFFSKYGKLLVDYNDEVFGNDSVMSITSDLTPPKDLMVEVRVMVDCGEIVTEAGTINLRKDTTHSVRRREVEELIRRGDVKEITAHEAL